MHEVLNVCNGCSVWWKEREGKVGGRFCLKRQGDIELERLPDARFYAVLR